jgi:hypothetical protein
MTYELTENDFEQLSNTSMKWGQSWKEQDDRFEVMHSDSAIDYSFEMAYWVGKEYTNVIFAKMFLTKHCCTYQVLWDLCGDCQYLITTNYKTDGWRTLDARNI